MDVHHGKYPNTFYRVSAKVVIRNAAGEVLVVKEHSDKWELPGGGLDHGESVHDCLQRELREELGITNAFTEQFSKVETQYMSSRPDKQLDFWKMSMYFDVVIEGEFTIVPGEGISEAKFMPASVLNDLYG